MRSSVEGIEAHERAIDLLVQRVVLKEAEGDRDGGAVIALGIEEIEEAGEGVEEALVEAFPFGRTQSS